jgi:hypothetical protein
VSNRLTVLKYKLLTNYDDRGRPIRQYVVAVACGMHPSTLSRYALGQEEMRHDHAKALGNYFKCRPEHLSAWMDEEEIEEAL